MEQAFKSPNTKIELPLEIFMTKEVREA